MIKRIAIILSLTISVIGFNISGTVLFAQQRVGQPHSNNLQYPDFGNIRNQALGELTVESFEDSIFPPNGWQKITDFGGMGWQRISVTSQVPGFQQGATVAMTPSGGGSWMTVASWWTGDEDGFFSTGQPTDQWLITPQITNIQPNDSLKFYLKQFSFFKDNLDVLISTTSDSMHAFTVVVANLSFDGNSSKEWRKYTYRLTSFVQAGSDIFVAFREHVDNTQVEGDALLLDLVEVGSFVTNVSERSAIPAEFQLSQNYPNPFNPVTQIAFSLPKSTKVTLKVHNILGQVVTELISDEIYPAGEHRVEFNAEHLPSGIYYYRIVTDDFVDVKRMTLLK